MQNADRKEFCFSTPPRWLLDDLLRQVSRSFYLTLKIVPSSIRTQAGLAYLFCRAADTIADTELLPSSQRLPLLLFYRNQFFPEPPNWEEIRQLGVEVVSGQGSPGEKLLLEELSACFELLETFDVEDKRLIGELVRTLCQGMEMDLISFSKGRPQEPQALLTLSDLDRYTYFVAGCVGDFWTRICCRHLSSLKEWDKEKMVALGVRFGKGLQMTNVLKDLSRDLSMGRCYLPDDLLKKHALDPMALLGPASRMRVLPLVKELTLLALEHLDQGIEYVLTIPRQESRLRLAVVWPLLFALATLQKVLVSPEILNPKKSVKISRGSVYGTMGLSTVQIMSNVALKAYFERFRERLTQTLHQIH